MIMLWVLGKDMPHTLEVQRSLALLTPARVSDAALRVTRVACHPSRMLAGGSSASRGALCYAASLTIIIITT